MSGQWPSGTIQHFVYLTPQMRQWAQSAIQSGANPVVARQAAVNLFRSAQPMANIIIQNMRNPSVMTAFIYAGSEASGMGFAAITASITAALSNPYVLAALILCLVVLIIVAWGQWEQRQLQEKGRRQKSSMAQMIRSPEYQAFLHHPTYGPNVCFKKQRLPHGFG